MAMSRAGREKLDRLRQEAGLDPRLPWGGRSPRVLTQAHQRFTLRQETAPVDELSDVELENQYQRFLQEEG